MTKDTSNEGSRRGKWWQWFSGDEADGESNQSSGEATAPVPYEPTAREIWLPAKRRMLGKVADFYEEEVNEAVASLSSLMEPLIMANLGVLIGGLVIAMYLPIFKLGAVV